MAQPWTKQDDEGPRAYAAFELFLSLGTARTLGLAYAEEHRRKYGETPVTRKAPRHWERWSAAFQWIARAEAWDSYMASQARKAQVEAWTARAKDIMRSEGERLNHQRTLHNAGVRLAGEGLRDLIQRQESGSVMTVSELSRLLRTLALVGNLTYESNAELLQIDKILMWYTEAQEGA